MTQEDAEAKALEILARFKVRSPQLVRKLTEAIMADETGGEPIVRVFWDKTKEDLSLEVHWT